MTEPVTADLLLDATAVGRVLRSMGLPVKYGCYGFSLPCLPEDFARIERGSGIAGRGGHWHIVSRECGKAPSATSSVATKRELRRLLREFLTREQKPPPRAGYIHYAKFNRNQYGEAYVWVTRRV